MSGFTHSALIAYLELPSRWADKAACRDLDQRMFFVERGESADDAKAVCATCDVIEDCLEYALGRNERLGVWGGRTAKERRRIRSARSAA